MKAKILQIASLLLVATACSQEELRNFGPNEATISAVMEGETRSHATDDGAFTWTKGDEISVYTSSGNFRTFTLNGEGGTATANFKGILLDDETITLCAAYPNSNNHKVDGNMFTFNLPAEYGDFETEYVPNTNAPMIALVEDNYTDFNFKHLGGVLRFKLSNVPVDAAQFVFTATDKDITGDFDADLTEATPTISARVKTNANSVTIKFKPLTSVQNDMTFFVPLPVGTYNGFNIAILDEDGMQLVDYTNNTSNTMARRTLARFTTLTFADINGSLEESGEQEPGTLTGNVAKLVEAGTLEKVLGEQKKTLTFLKIVGEINGTDVKCLRQMLNATVVYGIANDFSGKLKDLDLTEATIVGGGDYYYDSGAGLICSTSRNNIGDHMFSGAKNLSSILLSDGLESIGEGAFLNCQSLARIAIPDNVTTIGQNAFSMCKELKYVTLGNNVTTIYNRAFSLCSSLTNITIPNNVTAIGNGAFESCPLSEVTCLATTPPIVGTEIFETTNTLKVSPGCKATYEYSNWKSYFTNIIELGDGSGTIVNGVATLTLAGTLATVLEEETKTLTSLKIIGEINGTDFKCLRQMLGAPEFTEKGMLSSLDLSEASIAYGGDVDYYTYANTIPESAFAECENLTDIYLPNSITAIENSAFGDCKSMNVYITDLAAWCSIAFSNYDSNPLYAGYDNNAYDTPKNTKPTEQLGGKLYLNGSLVTDLSIGSEISEVKDYAFMGCSSLESVSISNTVLNGAHIFTFCSNLKKVTMGDNVTFNGSGVFQNCFSLESASISKDVTRVPTHYFRNCMSLKEIDIPDKVTRIEGNAFDGCGALTKITLGKSLNYIGWSAFADCDVAEVKSISEIISYAEKAPSTYDESVFSHASKSITLKVPAGSKSSYENSTVWSKFNIVEMDN